jgi:hypothetical protein
LLRQYSAIASRAASLSMPGSAMNAHSPVALPTAFDRRSSSIASAFDRT